MAKPVDRLFASPMETVPAFEFGEKTAEVFDDMLTRSEPLYAETQRMVAELVLQFSSDSPLVYDLGCSTGTAIVLIHEKLARAGRQPRLVGSTFRSRCSRRPL